MESDAHERCEIFDLALDAVALRICAVAAAATIIAVHGEVLSQQRSQLRHRSERAAAQRAVYQDECWTGSGAVVRDRGAVLGLEVFMVSSWVPRTTDLTGRIRHRVIRFLTDCTRTPRAALPEASGIHRCFPAASTMWAATHPP
jgi:hypothetical protein